MPEFSWSQILGQIVQKKREDSYWYVSWLFLVFVKAKNRSKVDPLTSDPSNDYRPYMSGERAAYGRMP